MTLGGDTIRAARIRAGLTQAQLAERLGKSQAAAAQLEGPAANPTLATLQRVLAAADSGNGVSAALDWREFLFINTDLSVHLLRPPVGEWVCLDGVTYVKGLGLSDTSLWDERGRIGRAAQTLLVRERAGA